jgi:hypothetical protein
MRQIIYALVEASTQEDALVTGKAVFGRFIGAGPHADAVFDYDDKRVRAPSRPGAGGPRRVQRRGEHAQRRPRHDFVEGVAYEGPSIYLDGRYGNGIRDREQPDRVIDESDDRWIVPADVHF